MFDQITLTSFAFTSVISSGVLVSKKNVITFWLEECLLVVLINYLADCSVYHSFYDFQKLLSCHSTVFIPT